MKKNGFTLVELLAVLVILSLLFILIAPTVADIISQSKETTYNKQVNTILKATYDYSLKNIEILPKENEIKYVTLGELKYEGLIDINIKDPKNGEKFKDNLVISINNIKNEDKINKNLGIKEGDYFYKLELDKLDVNKKLLPKIILEGIEQNSNGDYILILSLNEIYKEINYSATSSNGDSLSSNVRKYTMLKDVVVDNIDTSKPNVYKTYYTVIDNNGYANTSILNIIIGDNMPPILKIKEETILSKEINEFDLLSGVSCEDNSGYCEIEYSGEIDFGVVGKYVIEYEAKDPSGNTTTSKRIITIE